MKITMVVLVLALLGGGAVGPAPAEIVDQIVAVVNDEVITLSELAQMAKAMQTQAGLSQRPGADKALQREMLEALIDRKLAKADAKRRGITVSEKEMQAALERFRQSQQLTDDAALVAALAKAGVTLEEMKQQISDQIITDRLIQLQVGGKINISEEEMRRFYDSQYPKQGGEQVHLRMINLAYPPNASASQKEETKLKAEVLLQELRQKVPFEEIHKKHALPLNDLGFISINDLDAGIANFLRGLKPGDIAPIQTPQGFQLVKMVARRSGAPRSYEEVAPEIRQVLTRQEMERRFGEWVKTLRDKAHVKIML